MTTLELETKHSVAMSTKIAVGFVVATAIMVVASFAAAVFATLAQPKATAIVPTTTTQPTLTAAPGVQVTQNSIKGVTYDEVIVSTQP